MAHLKFRLLGGLVVGLFLTPWTRATHYVVTSEADFSALPSTLAAGDTVEIAPGTYTNVRETFGGTGTAAAPILIYANPLGSARFEGASSFALNGSYLTIAGLVFDGGGRPGSSNGVFDFRPNSYRCRVTHSLIRDFDVGEDYANWVFMAGFENRLDHCHFEGKASGNTTVFIKPDVGSEAGPTVPRHHRVDHNYFGPRTIIGDNGYESIRIGDSARQMYELAVVVEYNLFDRAIQAGSASEMEVISNKSKGNIYRYNTFTDNDGQLTLRHGDACIVEGNFFFGTGGSRESGVRVIGQDHIIRNNYFENIGGTGLRATLVVMAGDSNWPAADNSNGYETPHRALFANNTFVRCQQPINLGENKSDGQIPTGVRVINNVAVSNPNQSVTLRLQFDSELVEFAGNLFYRSIGSYGATGLSGVTYGVDPHLAPDAARGYEVPGAGSAVINAGVAVDPPVLGDLAGQIRSDGSIDIGATEVGATGPVVNRPLTVADVGPDFDGGSVSSGPEFLLTFLPDAPLDGTYEEGLIAVGGMPPLVYSVVAGSLPGGLSLASATGMISGTPTAAGFYSFTVRVEDDHGAASEAAVVLRVLEIDRVPTLQTADLPPAFRGEAYVVTFEANSGDAPLSWSVTSGALPSGLSLSAAGVLAGTPGEDGIFTFEVSVTDADGDVDRRVFTLLVVGAGGSLGAYREVGGQMVMEAEHFTDAAPLGAHAWEVVTAGGASGGATDNAIQALPNSGSSAGAAGDGASVAYRVEFATAGDYIIHVRGTGPDGSSDSVHVSVDGSTTDFRTLSLSSSEWVWKRSTNAFSITPGLHTIHVWMREPGSIVDKIVVSLSSTSLTGEGPPASPRPVTTFSFASWKLDRLGENTLPDHDDSDGDLYTLLEEYFWDLDPTAKDAPGARPQGAVESGELVLSFRQNRLAGDVRVYVEAGADLATWPATIYDSAVDEGPAEEGDRFRLAEEIGSSASVRFWRIRYELENAQD